MRGNITIMAGVFVVNSRGPVASFDVPVCHIGSKANPSSAQRNPVDVPATGPNGNNDTTSPATVLI